MLKITDSADRPNPGAAALPDYDTPGRSNAARPPPDLRLVLAAVLALSLPCAIVLWIVAPALIAWRVAVLETLAIYRDAYHVVIFLASLLTIAGLVGAVWRVGGILGAVGARARVIRAQNDTPLDVGDLRRPDWGRVVEGSLARHYDTQTAWAEHSALRGTTYGPSVHYAVRNDIQALPAPADAPLALPSAPPLAELVASGWTPTRERVLLGFTAAGPLYGKIDALLSTAIAGRPGQGKSTLLRATYYQTVRAGGSVGILDPHGSILDDVRGAPARFVASTGKELTDAAGYLVAELESRLQQYRDGRRDFPPALYLTDEFPVIGLASKPAVEAIGRVVLEGRKVAMYGLISGQGLPAASFGGRLVRDALSSRYIFKTSADEARRCGLTGEAARLVLDLRPGVAILDGPVDPTPIAVPNCTGADLAALAGGAKALTPDAAAVATSAPTSPLPFGFRPSPAVPAVVGTGQATGRQPAGTTEAPTSSPGSATADPETVRVVSLFLAGKTIPEIVTEVYQVSASTGGRKYTEARDRVESILRSALKGGAS